MTQQLWRAGKITLGVLLLVLGVIGLSLDLVFRRFNRRVFHWAATDRR